MIASDLGDEVESFGFSGARVGRWHVPIVLGGLASVGAASVIGPERGGWIVAAALGLVFVAWAVRVGRHDFARLSVTVFERGAFIQPETGPPVAVPFDEVREVRGQFEWPPYPSRFKAFRVILVLKGGTELRLPPTMRSPERALRLLRAMVSPDDVPVEPSTPRWPPLGSPRRPSR
ncbi:MAG: hypothetical protein HYX53_01100 [Chloroflexi bacterium]|nr:hypothetical protein [Chloroflexota bacterium]